MTSKLLQPYGEMKNRSPRCLWHAIAPRPKTLIVIEVLWHSTQFSPDRPGQRRDTLGKDDYLRLLLGRAL